MVMNYTEVESKVREATNDEAWGPTGETSTEMDWDRAREGGSGVTVLGCQSAACNSAAAH